MKQPDDSQDAGFAAAFADPTERPEPKAEAPAPVESQEEVTPDPAPEYVQITREDYARLSQAVERLPVLEQQMAKRLDTAFGKLGVIEQGIRQGGGALSDQDLAPFKDEFPELHAVLSKVRAPADVVSVVDERTKAYQEQLESAMQQLRETQMYAVEREHPDWQAFTASEAFQGWLATKDEGYRAKVMNTWAPSVIVPALNEAKKALAAKPAPTPTKQKQTPTRAEVLGAAIQPRGTGGRYEAAGNTEAEGYAAAWGG
jgi:type I site-specific restriction endonuclease